MSHNCDEALANLYLYLDSELDEVTSERIRSHLKECNWCSAPFDFEVRLKTVVRSKIGEEVPDELMERLRGALAAEVGNTDC